MAYIGKQPTIGNFVKLDTITTSATATYNLLSGGVAYSPQSANHCIVSLNGVIQSPNTSFTISGSTIVFASTLSATDVIDFILILGDTLNVGVPSDATVGFSKITSNLITGATSETSIADADTLLIYDDSATALRKMTKSNLFSGIANTPAFEAKLSSNQTATHATITKVQINSEIFDTNNCYDSSTNYRFTPTTAGKYYVYAAVSIYNTTNPDTIIFSEAAIYKNGSVYRNNRDNPGSGVTPNANTTMNYVNAIIDMNGTSDYLEFFALGAVSTSSPIFLNANATDNTYFGAYRLIGV